LSKKNSSEREKENNSIGTIKNALYAMNTRKNDQLVKE
jgi:hypothetical protein